MCLPCDHMTYGDVGCEKNCKIDDRLGFVCDEFGCKDGYYSLNKIDCMNCNALGHEFCSKCSNLPPSGKSPSDTDERIFKCQKCISNEYAVYSDGRCHHCYSPHCSRCHFQEGTTKSICDSCYYDYYLRNGNCISCHHYSIYGGYCRQCTDNSNDLDNIYCYCEKGYIKSSEHSCEKCPRYCKYCTYDQSLSRTKCIECESLFRINSLGACTYCGRGCSYCSLDENDQPICHYCSSGYDLIDGKCYKCPNNCRECHLDEEKDEFICDECYSHKYMNSNKECFDCPYGCDECHIDEINNKVLCDNCYFQYALNPQKQCTHCPDLCDACHYNNKGELKCTSCISDPFYNFYYILNGNSLCESCKTGCYDCYWKESTSSLACRKCFTGYALKDEQCISCHTIPQFSGGCETCSYSRSSDSFLCHSCINKDYAYSTNTHECILNTDSTNPQLYGCLRAIYNSVTSKYECNICKPEFIPILNDKNCRPPSIANLHSDCREAINIGTESAPIYSCTSCKSRFNYFHTNVTDHRGAHDCYQSTGELILCKKATKDEAGNLQCTECFGNFKLDFSSTYNKNVCDITCKADGFMKYNWCYRCDDKYVGNPGCINENGCTYLSDNDQLNCNGCKVGYFGFTYGQCFQCKEGDKYCTECHMNETESRFECEKCLDGYFVNENKKCQLITCDEHPEVTPGCIICIDKLTQYKPEGKCQACKEGYFKTKDETCVHCKAKKNGGPGCELCGYAKDEEGNDTDEIICNYCPEGFLTSDGKCYNCKDELENGCQNCTLKVNEDDQTEKLVCTKCINERYYILTNNSHCVHINSFVQRFPFCSYQYSYLEKYEIVENSSTNDTIPNTDMEDFFFFNDTNNTNNIRYEYQLRSYCSECKEGYIKENGTCQPLNLANCTLAKIIPLGLNNLGHNNFTGEYEGEYFEKIWNDYYNCESLCWGSKYVKITHYYQKTEEVEIRYESNISDYDIFYDNYTNNTYDDSYKWNNTIEEKEEVVVTEMRNISYIFHIDESLVYNEYLLESYTNESQVMNIISKSYLCLDNLGTGVEYSPENLRKCKSANYYENNDTYECTECITNYILDEETKTCKQSIKVNMNLRPGFSNCYAWNIGNYSNPLYSCYYCHNYGDILVTSDTGAKFCASKVGELAGCSEVYADTTYLNNVYNCTYCTTGFISYYNIFFEKITCQNINTPPDKIREIDSTIFDPDEVEHVLANESGLCETGKLFTPDGINCYACNNRTVGMVGCKGTCEFNLKKNISLKCEEGMCKTGFIEKTKGVCEPCETINLGCIECHYEDNYLEGYYGFKRKRRFACDQCDNGYLKSEDGTCHHCSTLDFTNCKNCGVDPNHDNEIVCLECQPGYFVNDEGKCTYCYENRIRGKNNICISCDDIENGGIEGCQQCQNVDNEPQCTQCKQGFILLENNYTCLRISSNVELEELSHCNLTFLNDNGHFECKKCENNFVLLEENNNTKCFSKNHIPSINPDICEIFENLGNEDKPIYSCVSCRKSEFEDIYPKEGKARITYQINNTAICEYRHRYSSLENCTEAVMIPDNLNVTNFKLNCTECIEDNILYYHKDTDMNICKYKYFEKQCVVKYCKTCVPGNNYYCQECLPANYEVSSLTGGCVRKVDKSPAVYFKDIFRLKLNQYKQIGAKRYYGPFFSLRGLTNSQVNTGHAFLVLLSFKLHYTRNNRMLEEEKSVKTYCQIVESMDETSGEPNLVDFDCIGDTNEEEDLSEYDLNAIEESPDDNIFEGSNLNELAQSTDLKNLGNKNKTSFELKNYIDLVVFNPNEVNNITSKDYHFDLTLSGKLNKDLQEQSLNVQIPLNQIQDKKVGCTFNIKTERNAELKCDLDFKEYEDNFNMFSLKLTEITDSSDTTIYLSRINEIKLIPEGKDKDNTVLIVVIVVVCVVVIAGGIVGGIFLYKRYKKKKSENNILDNNNKGNESAQNPSYMNKVGNVVPDSKEQVINFQN